ncbi:MAG: thioredoxin family protein [Planctomycetota bacterium]
MTMRERRVNRARAGFAAVAWAVCGLALAVLAGGATAQLGGGAEPVTVSAAFAAEREGAELAAGGAVEPGGRGVVAVVLEMTGKWHVWPDEAQARPVEGLFQIHTTAEVSAARGADGEEIEGLLVSGVWQRPPPVEVEAFGQSILAWEGTTVLYLPVAVSPGAEPGVYEVAVSVGYQACDDQVCLPPRTVEAVATVRVGEGDGDGASDTEVADGEAAGVFAGFDAGGFETIGQGAVEGVGQAGASDMAQAQGEAAGLTGTATVTLAALLPVIGLALVGGALLNVMPCVLPVIPIKILGLAQAAPDPRRRAFLGAVMAAGVVAFWLAIGGVVVGLSEAISWLFGYAWFNLALGGLIVVMAIGMCGVWTMRLPAWVYAINPKHDSVTGAFGFGVMTGVLATPCTGPILGSVAGGVLQSGPLVVLVVFGAIGVGMALPYFVLSLTPGLVERLPRTGPASELLKQVLAILMGAAGAFFVGVGINIWRNDGLGYVYPWFWWLAGGVAAAAGIWLAIRTLQITPSAGRRLGYAGLGLAFAAVSMGTAYEFTRPSAIAWVYYTPEAFDEALASDRAVMLDFTADWCINCKVLERTVLESEPVLARLASSDVVAMKADLTSQSAPGWAKLAAVDRAAIPLLVVFEPEGGEVFKAEFYTPSQVVAAIDRATGGGAIAEAEGAAVRGDEPG